MLERFLEQTDQILGGVKDTVSSLNRPYQSVLNGRKHCFPLVWSDLCLKIGHNLSFQQPLLTF